jgi:hypothetical protein
LIFVLIAAFESVVGFLRKQIDRNWVIWLIINGF